MGNQQTTVLHVTINKTEVIAYIHKVFQKSNSHQIYLNQQI